MCYIVSDALIDPCIARRQRRSSVRKNAICSAFPEQCRLELSFLGRVFLTHSSARRSPSRITRLVDVAAGFVVLACHARDPDCLHHGKATALGGPRELVLSLRNPPLCTDLAFHVGTHLQHEFILYALLVQFRAQPSPRAMPISWHLVVQNRTKSSAHVLAGTRASKIRTCVERRLQSFIARPPKRVFKYPGITSLVTSPQRTRAIVEIVFSGPQR